MPYIALDRREMFESSIQQIADEINQGEVASTRVRALVGSIGMLVGLATPVPRGPLYARVRDLLLSYVLTVGDRNYIITELILRTNPARYADYNRLVGIIRWVESDLLECPNTYTALDLADMLGVLECAKLEFYRRGAAPYEDLKIVEAGDLPGYAQRRYPPSQPGSAAPTHIQNLEKSP